MAVDGAMAEALAAEIRAQLAKVPEAAGFVRDWPDAPLRRDCPAIALEVCGWLAALPGLAVPGSRGLVQALVAAAPGLGWRQTYGVADFGAAFLARYGWTEIIGLRGPLASDRLACGFLLLGPGVAYPAHAHEAEELYLPLAGTALWQRGAGGFETLGPGAVIHHPAWMPHATTTLQEPMLALYLWRGGDLAAKSKILGRE